MDHLAVLRVTLAFLGFAILSRGDSDRCMLPIRKSTIEASWQSSSFDQPPSTCFWSRLADEVGNWPFLHSKVGLQSADAGFHWFVIKLRQQVSISSVFIRGRTLTQYELTTYGDNLTARAADIEVWTSPEDLDFGSNHCDSRNISSVFQGAKSGTWRLCGRTPTSVSSGKILTVNCARHKVRIIILRRNVANETEPVRQCLSFVDMWINRSITLETVFHPASAFNNAAELGSSVTVQCDVLCPVVSSEPIRLTHSTFNVTLDSGNRTYTIHQLELHHGGNYTCSSGGTGLEASSTRRLRVLYPPKKLRIAVDKPSSCSAESFGHVTFSFTSSTSDPKSEHQCVAFDNMGNNLNVSSSDAANKSLSSDFSESLTSHWRCLNCCSGNKEAQLKLECTAAQANGTWLSNVTVKTLCTSIKSDCDRNQDLLMFVLLAVGLMFANVFVISAVTFIYRRKMTSTQGPPVQVLKAAMSEEVPVPLQQLSTTDAPGLNNTDDDNNCIYFSMMPKQNCGSTEIRDSNSRPVSDVTEYTEIVADR